MYVCIPYTGVLNVCILPVLKYKYYVCMYVIPFGCISYAYAYCTVQYPGQRVRAGRVPYYPGMIARAILGTNTTDYGSAGTA